MTTWEVIEHLSAWPDMRVTIRDVARKVGVSPMTVSRVINASPRVSDDTRRRVQGAIAELGYVPTGSRVASSIARPAYSA
jgi:LacI family transcriptional regulator